MSSRFQQNALNNGAFYLVSSHTINEDYKLQTFMSNIKSLYNFIKYSLLNTYSLTSKSNKLFVKPLFHKLSKLLQNI